MEYSRFSSDWSHLVSQGIVAAVLSTIPYRYPGYLFTFLNSPYRGSEVRGKVMTGRSRGDGGLLLSRTFKNLDHFGRNRRRNIMRLTVDSSKQLFSGYWRQLHLDETIERLQFGRVSNPKQAAHPTRSQQGHPASNLISLAL